MEYVDLTCFLNPFTHEKTPLQVAAIGNLIDTIDNSGLTFPAGVHATILLNGEVVPQEEWETTVPKPGDAIVVKLIPQGGGGGKNILRAVMTVALIAGTWGTGTLFAGAWQGGMGTFLAGGAAGGWAAVGINTALTYTGMLLIDKIAPLPTVSTSRKKEDEPKTWGIESSTNRMNPWGAVPVLLGKHRFHPPYAAQPYSEIVGDDQYINMLFCVGYAPVYIEDMKLGTTDIDDYIDSEVDVDATSRNIEHWVHENFDANNSTLNYFKNDIHEDTTSYELTYNNAIILTTQPNTDEIIIDITAPNGVYGFSSSGAKTVQTVNFDIFYGNNASNNWIGGTSAINKSANNFAIPLPGNALVVDPDADHYSLTQEVVGYSYTRIGIDKTNGAWWTANSGNNSYKSATIARKRCPNFPGYIAPICGITRSSNVASMNNTAVTDLRTDELNCGNNAVEFVPSASGNNVHIAAGNITPDTSIGAATSATIRRGYRFKMNNAGTWDVKIVRTTEDHDPAVDNIYDTIYCTALRSVNGNRHAVNMSGLCLVELRVKASEQFNGQLDDFTVLATSVCKDYVISSETWTERPTANPAALYRYLLQGAFNKRPREDAEIDLAGLATWYEYCVGEGFGFNLYCDYQTSLFEMLINIAAAGRSSPTYKDGKYSVVTDSAQTTPIQHFTERNSWGFSSSKTFYESPHAFRITMADEAQDYFTEEAFVYDDGYNSTNATLFEELKLIGCTNYDQAWKHGRFHLAQLRLRPETMKINVDIENLVCTRGDLVRVTHDVPMWGLGTGRIKSLNTSGNNITGVTIDEQCSMNNNNNYAVRIRLSDGNSSYHNITTVAGNQTSFNFITPVASNNNNISIGDLLLFGEASDESVECLVKNIRPTSDLCAEIELMDYSPAVYTSWNNNIPAYDTHINTPPSDIAPVISSVRSDERVMIRRGNIWSPRILVNFKPRASDRLANISYMEGNFKVAYSKASWLTVGVIPKDAGSVYVDNVEQGVTYWLRFRYIYRDGHAGPWCSTYSHEVVGKSGYPSDASFDDPNCEFTSNRIKFAMLPMTDFDFDFFEIRTDTDFGDEDGLIIRTKSTVYIYSGILAINQTYYLKACDTSGIYSLNYDSITAPTSDTFEMGSIVTEFSTIDCTLTWAGLDSKKLDYYQLAAYNNSSMNATTELIYTSNQFIDPHFTFDFWTNNNCSGGPYRELWFRVTAHDIYGRSSYADAYAINEEPAIPTDCTAIPGIGMLTITCSPMLGDVVGYQFACDEDNPPSNNQEVGTSFAVFSGLNASNNYYYRGRARDPFGYSNNWSNVAGPVSPLSVEMTPQDMDIPVTRGANFNASTGVLAWDAHNLTFKGNTYSIPAGNAGNNVFAYWNVAEGNNGYNSANSMALTGELWMMCYRYGNNAYPAFQSRIIHGSLIQVNTLYGNRIVANSLSLNTINGASGSLNISAGGNITLDGGNLSILSGNFIVSTANGISISSGGGINVQSGGGINLAGNATSPGRLRIYASGLSGNYIELSGLTANNYVFTVNSHNIANLYFSQNGTSFRNIYAYAARYLGLMSNNGLGLQALGSGGMLLSAASGGFEIIGNMVDSSITNISRVATGNYTGDGNNNRNIVVGWEPNVVFVNWARANGANTFTHMFLKQHYYNNNANQVMSVWHGASQMFCSGDHGGNFTSNGFTVSLGADGYGPNANNNTYEWVALG